MYKICLFLAIARASTRSREVLKQVHPNTGISKRGMSILNSFINDIFERLALEASKLSRYNKKSTLSTLTLHTYIQCRRNPVAERAKGALLCVCLRLQFHLELYRLHTHKADIMENQDIYRSRFQGFRL